jgi:hypothetical protein
MTIETHIIKLGSANLHTNSDNEMTKKKKVYIWNFCYFQIYIYRIQIVQNTAQLSSKGRFD